MSLVCIFKKQLSISTSIFAALLLDPDNDFFELRADDLRDERSYRRRIQASAKKLANNIESAIAKQATEMGSLVVHDMGRQ